MRRILIFVISILILLAVIDLLSGFFMDRYVRTHRLPGDSESIDYTIKDIDEDIIILGNSVALNSIMPSVLSDSLGLTVYNAASNGQTMAFFKTMLDIILSRHKPKAVIIGIKDDIIGNDRIGDRYNILVPYYNMGYEGIDSCLNSQSSEAPFFLKSNLYRYNTIWWRLLLYHFVSPNEKGENGFIAKPIPAYPPKMQPYIKEEQISKHMESTLNQMIELCDSKDVKLIFVAPPLYFDFTNSKATALKSASEILSREGLTL